MPDTSQYKYKTNSTQTCNHYLGIINEILINEVFSGLHYKYHSSKGKPTQKR